jgi:3-deoxy-D-manno-octulosonic-acid transferase
MILAYRVLTIIVYPLLFIFILFRIIFKKEDKKRYKEKILISKFNVIKKKNCKLIWFHAASIGEFQCILPIIDELNYSNTNLEFLITTTTLSSSNLASRELKKYINVQHRFFPFDVEFIMKKFLTLWKPSVIFLVETEFWPNLILQANNLKIPLGLINGRLTKKSFNRWMFFPNTAKKIFGQFNFCLTANSETKDYLLKLNVKNIFFCGNIKLINKINVDKIQNINKEILLKRKFWFAASTHKSEEIFCLKTHAILKKKYKNLLTIIAPRHIDRVKDIKKICKKQNLNFQILNKNEMILDGKEVIIINTFGELPNYFKYSKSVFIGKSTIRKLRNVGGQNPIDAAKLGCKIYHGPYVYNFKETYKILEEHNVSKKIDNPYELSNNLMEDLKDKEKIDMKISNLINELGKRTLIDTMKNINKFLFDENK